MIKSTLAVLFLMTATAAFAADPPSAKHSGWVSDSMCAEKHAGAANKDVACVTKCIKGGDHPVFVDDQSKKVMPIDNPASVKDFYGQHVSVDAKAGSVTSSIYIIKARSI